jgi:enoyl-CoA hydratase
LRDLPIAVIAAVNGFALGGGCEMALACDFIYAAQGARFGLPEISLGLIPGFGGTQRLPRLVGTNLAKELIFTGKMLSAEEARAAGLVNRICPPEDLMPETLKTARIIAAKGRVALRAAKQAINHGVDVDLPAGCRMETDAFALCIASADAREGTTAFLEKRPPLFKAGFEE